MEQALHLAVAIGHKRAEMHAYMGLGIAASDRGDYARATEMYTHGKAMASEYGEPGDIATTAANLGLVAWQIGNHESALAYWEESVEINAQIGDVMNEAPVQTNLGAVKKDLGRIDEAEIHFRRALELQRSINSRVSLAITLLNYGEVAFLSNEPCRARARYEEARDILRESGIAILQAAAAIRLASVYSVEGDVRQAASLILDAITLLDDTREPMRVLELVEATAAVSNAAGYFADAAEMLAARARIQRDHGDGGVSIDTGRLEAMLRKELDAAAFDTAWQTGLSLDLDAMRTRARIIARRIVGRRVQGAAVVLPEAGARPEPAAPSLDYSLTAREMDVLRLLGAGKGTQEIAHDLAISSRTVMTHIGNILAKLDVTSRTAAVALAIREGVISSGG